MTDKIQSLLNAAAQVIYDKKGTNILALDVRGLSSMTDYLVIAEGHADRHVTAIAHAVEEKLGELGIHPLHAEGIKEGDWAVLDYGDVMVHLFKPGFRDKYLLERLWEESRLVDLSINVSVS